MNLLGLTYSQPLLPALYMVMQKQHRSICKGQHINRMEFRAHCKVPVIINRCYVVLRSLLSKHIKGVFRSSAGDQNSNGTGPATPKLCLSLLMTHRNYEKRR